MNNRERERLNKRLEEEYGVNLTEKNPKVNNSVVEQVQKSKKGGMLTFLAGHLFPIKQWVSNDELRTTDKTKHCVKTIINIAHHFLKDYTKDPDDYCPFVRELYRIMSLWVERDQRKNMKKKWAKVRDVICVILENDLSYRYPMQDALSEIDLEKIKPDEGDLYWMQRRRKQSRYNYGGKKADN